MNLPVASMCYVSNFNFIIAYNLSQTTIALFNAHGSSLFTYQ